jgi:hypothetical protein
VSRDFLFRSACRLRAEHIDIGAGGEEARRPCSNPGISLADAVWNVIRFVSVTRTMVLIVSCTETMAQLDPFTEHTDTAIRYYPTQ